MKAILFILILSLSITFNFYDSTTKKPSALKRKIIPTEKQNYQQLDQLYHGDDEKYVFFFTDFKDIEEGKEYLPLIIDNKFYIIDIVDTTVVTKIRINPIIKTRSNVFYLINRKLVDDDDEFEVTEHFFSYEINDYFFRVIDNNGKVLCKDRGIPSLHRYRYERRLTILNKFKIETFNWDHIYEKNMSKRKYLTLEGLFNSLIDNILYKIVYKPKLEIDDFKTFINYYYNFNGYTYIITRNKQFYGYNQAK